METAREAVSLSYAPDLYIFLDFVTTASCCVVFDKLSLECVLRKSNHSTTTV